MTEPLGDEPILSVRNLKKHYPITEGVLSREVGAARAVDGISFDLHPGETLGLVGESGCGKSTAASSIIRLEEATDGEVIFNGGDRWGRRPEDGSHPNDVTRFDDEELMSFRRDAQMIFQDPSSSFDPRMSVGASVAEPLMVHGMNDKTQRREIVEDLLERVGLSADDYERYPHEFSGGQKQRIALARALVLNPELIVADEPVSALDVSIRAEILSLISDLQDEFGLSMLFISHDMSVIREVCDRVAVMYLGEIVEIGDAEDVFSDPQHPYTEALLSAIPTPDPRTDRKDIELRGTVPSPTDPPDGCRFHTRCHRVIQPADIDMVQEHWRSLLNFRDQAAAGGIDVESAREVVRVEAEGEEPSDAAVKEEIRSEFELPESLSDAAAEETLDESLDLLLAGDEAAASERLGSAFTTPCEQSDPELTDHGDGHRSACLLHDADQESQDIAAADD